MMKKIYIVTLVLIPLLGNVCYASQKNSSNKTELLASNHIKKARTFFRFKKYAQALDELNKAEQQGIPQKLQKEAQALRDQLNKIQQVGPSSVPVAQAAIAQLNLMPPQASNIDDQPGSMPPQASNIDDQPGEYVCSQDDYRDYLNEGEKYYYGTGVPADRKRSIELYLKANNPNALIEIQKKAQIGLARIYYIGGYGIDKDDAKAVAYYKQVNEPGSTNGMRFQAQMAIGQAYYHGRYGIKKDYKQAVDFLTQAVNQETDHPENARAAKRQAQYLLGKICHEGGYGIVKNDDKAKGFFQQAEAKEMLEKMESERLKKLINYIKEQVEKKPIKKIVELFKEGQGYFFGDNNKPQDWAKAAEYFVQVVDASDSGKDATGKAIPQGLKADALMLLGEMYFEGHDTLAQDWKKAASFLHRINLETAAEYVQLAAREMLEQIEHRIKMRPSMKQQENEEKKKNIIALKKISKKQSSHQKMPKVPSISPSYKRFIAEGIQEEPEEEKQ